MCPIENTLVALKEWIDLEQEECTTMIDGFMRHGDLEAMKILNIRLSFLEEVENKLYEIETIGKYK